MTINNIHNLPFFDMKMYEKFSYDHLCRQLCKCSNPVTILNLIQDLLEFSDNRVFNDVMIYDQLSFCLKSFSCEIRKRAMLVLYRCLIFIEENNTNNIVYPVFNCIIQCAFENSLNMKRISLQCLLIIISDLSIDEIIPYIENACREFLKIDKKNQSQKFSVVIRELFSKLPFHLKREEILGRLGENIENENDFHHVVYEFISRITSRRTFSTDNSSWRNVTVFRGDLFPKRFSQLNLTENNLNKFIGLPKTESKMINYEEKFEHAPKVSMKIVDPEPQLCQIIGIKTISSEINSSSLENKNEVFQINNLSSKVRRQFPNEFFQAKIKQNTLFKADKIIKTNDKVMKDGIYGCSAEQPDYENESVPSYYLESIRKSATKKREALLRNTKFSKSAVYHQSFLKKNSNSWKAYEDTEAEVADNLLPRIHNSDNNQMKFTPKRTISYPLLMKEDSKNLEGNQMSKFENQKNEKMKKFQVMMDDIASRLADSDWNKICEGLSGIQQLMRSDQVGLLDSNQIRWILSLISDTTKSLRSQVSRLGIQTLTQVIQCLGLGLDSDADLIAAIIIGKAGEINKFIRDDLNKTIKCFLISLSLEKSLIALNKLALHHRNGNVRKIFAENVNWLLTENLQNLNSNNKIKNKIIEISRKMAKDSNEETRYYAKAILKQIPEEWLEDEHI